MNIKEIKSKIEAWDKTCNEPQSFEFIQKINSIYITREQFKKWENTLRHTPKRCYLYFGFSKDKVCAFLCADYIKQVKLVDEIVVCNVVTLSEYNNDNPCIPESVESSRRLMWKTESEDWFRRVSKTGDVVRYFEVPFKDLSYFFEDNNTEKVSMLFGLVRNEEVINYIELILTDISAERSKKCYADLTRPCPPFGINK